MKNPYTILTIGPIYDTLMLADKTRAFWGASILFSWLNNKTLAKLIDDGYQENIIVPHIEKREFLNMRHRAGLLHDRIILKGSYADILQAAFDNAVDNAIKHIDETLRVYPSKYDKLDPLTEDGLKEAMVYLKEYFHSYIIEVDVPFGDNPILYISPLADSAEYQPRFGQYTGKHYLTQLFDRVNRSPFKRDIFTDKEVEDIVQDRRFKSTAEIAAFELIDKWETKDGGETTRQELFYEYKDIEDTEIYDKLESDFKEELKPYHKYYAIVQSDGDGFGKYLNAIGDNSDKLKNLSANLFNYLIASVEYIRANGGMVVYAGGDDLLFFAPVVNGDNNIFSFISDLDGIFEDHFKEAVDSGYKNLSISYGVNISYYKSPLYESLEKAHKQLNDKAKETKWKSGNQKNALAVNIEKHSGGTHQLTLEKSTTAYKDFLVLIKDELDSEHESSLPHGFHGKLKKFKVKFKDAAVPEQIDNFFNNEFELKDTDIYLGKKIALEKTRDILKSMLFEQEDCIETSDDAPSATEVLFFMLKSIKMLRGDE